VDAIIRAVDLIKLRPGVPVERAVDALRRVALDAADSNSWGATHSQDEIVDRYLQWSEVAEIKLGNVVELELAHELIRTPGYWSLRTAPRDAIRLPTLVRSEYETRQRLLDELADDLQQDRTKATDHAVNDTHGVQMAETAVADPERARKVFVVHGRNEAARVAMFTFLRAIGLAPIEWSEALAMTGEASPYIGQVLDTALGAAQSIVVLMTPDDVAYLRTEYASGEGDPETNPTAQARPNVLFEAGMAMGRDAKRTVLVELGKLRPFSDVAGRHAVRMANTPQSRTELAGRLRTAGCAVNTDGTDWLTAGDFTPPPEPGGGLPLGKRLPSATGPAGVRLDAKYHDRSNGGRLEIINHGSEPVFDVNLELPESLQGFHLVDRSLPIERLPPGKSVMLVCIQTMETDADYFDLVITGRTAAGDDVRQDAFVSLVR
jgi:predicted nucleotide-binding protein